MIISMSVSLTFSIFDILLVVTTLAQLQKLWHLKNTGTSRDAFSQEKHMPPILLCTTPRSMQSFPSFTSSPKLSDICETYFRHTCSQEISNHLTVSQMRSKSYGSRSFSAIGPRPWNDLQISPGRLRHCQLLNLDLRSTFPGDRH